VRKTVSEGRTRTVVEPIEGETRVAELAQMLGGESENTYKIARSLMERDGVARDAVARDA
jgi:DNA repair ATPase RecN